MKRHALFGFRWLVLLFLAHNAFAQHVELPDRIDSVDPVDPYFISAEAALRLTSEDRAFAQIGGALSYLRDQPVAHKCIQIPVFNSGHKPRGGKHRLSDLLQRVDTVATATVEGARSGFRGNEPGQLLKLRFEEILRGTLDLKTAFFFVPAGEIEMWGRRYCIDSPGVPAPPSVGGRLLLLLPTYGLDAERSTLDLPVTHFLTLPRTGPIRASSYLQLDSAPECRMPPDSEEFLALIRQRLIRDT